MRPLLLHIRRDMSQTKSKRCGETSAGRRRNAAAKPAPAGDETLRRTRCHPAASCMASSRSSIVRLKFTFARSRREALRMLSRTDWMPS